MSLNFGEIADMFFSTDVPENHRLALGRTLSHHLTINRLQPFDVGVEHDARTFKGRSREKELILESGTANIAVFGGRKFGKTWLAKNVEYACSSAEYYKATFLPVYASIQSAKSSLQAADQILESLLRLNFNVDWSGDKLSSLRKMLGRHQGSDGRVLFLILDEVDNLLAKHDVELFEMLRQLQSNMPGKFKVMLVGFKELFRAFSEEATNNPLANWISPAHRMPLSYLTLSETKELVQEPFRDMGLEVNGDAVIALIHNLTGGHPYYIQDLCARILQFAHDNSIDKVSEDAVSSVLRDGYSDSIEGVYHANLSSLQILIGSIFFKAPSFKLESVADELDRIGISVPLAQLKAELLMMAATSAIRKIGDSYSFVPMGVAEHFFSHQEPTRWALDFLAHGESR